MNEGLEPAPGIQTPPGGHGPADFNLRDYLDVVRRHWRILVVGAVIGAGIGLMQYLNTPETYQAATRIQIQRRSTNLLGNQTTWLESC